VNGPLDRWRRSVQRNDKIQEETVPSTTEELDELPTCATITRTATGSRSPSTYPPMSSSTSRPSGWSAVT
jgi:hypothetical protein